MSNNEQKQVELEKAQLKVEEIQDWLAKNSDTKDIDTYNKMLKDKHYYSTKVSELEKELRN